MKGFTDVVSLVAARAALAPDTLALAGRNSRVTYGALDRRSNRLAHGLRALGVDDDHLVGLLSRRSPALAVGALGIMKAGGAYLPLDPLSPPARLATILSDAKPEVVVAESDLSAAMPSGPWTLLSIAPDGSGFPDERDAAPDGVVIDPARRAYVIFTSGSTGTPRGVEITHAGLANLVAWHVDAFHVTPEDRATQIASPAFDAAVWEIWPYLAAGASVHAPDERTELDPAALRDWLVQERITVTFLATPLAERLMALPWPERTALRAMLTGADTLHRYPPPSLPFAVVNNYGPTECTVVTTSGQVPVDAGQPDLPSIGTPIAGVDVHVLDDAGRPVGPGETGELHVGGVGLARGYLNRPDLTAERFIAHPAGGPGARLYRTGDRARWRDDGTLSFLGRIDDQIKIRGHRIEPEEIVTVLDAHPLVAASAVAARADGAGEPRLVAYVVAVPGAAPTPRALLDTLRRRLPQYMCPSVFVGLDALPVTANGKIDRRALPSPAEATLLRDVEDEAPRDPIEQRLAQILATLLEVETVNRNENFFLLGGHSLLGTQVIARIRQVFGVDLSLRTLFERPTLAALSAQIVAALTTG